MKLAPKIAVTIGGVLALTVVSNVALVLSARQVGTLMQAMVTDNLSSVKAAEELEIALLEQRGYVSSYIVDGGSRVWLAELERRKPNFAHWLVRTRETAHTPAEVGIVGELERMYQEFDAQRESVIALYEQGKVVEAKTALLHTMNPLYERTYALCEEFIATNERYIEAKIADGQRRIRRNTLTTGVYVLLSTGLSLGLLWFFYRGILLPLRRMAADAHSFAVGERQSVSLEPPQDELRAVGFHLRSLMSDMSETRSDLERSRGQLMNAEKLASVGKLAASMAHEIRNPLTSLKMRLYTLRQAMGDNPLHEDDFRVVSEEIARLESIVRNFLEFTRPPVLKLHPHNVVVLVDKTLELCGHRLEEQGIRLVRDHHAGLPPVMADAEQVKQVFLNLLSNAVEAMEEGGELRIATESGTDRDGLPVAVIRFTDTGPGIAADVRSRIFEPFYSTKEGGTGLGLCIAARIMARHGGRLELEPAAAPGTSFAVWIPAAQGGLDEQDTRS
jgi:signal transduction histidine kinase